MGEESIPGWRSMPSIQSTMRFADCRNRSADCLQITAEGDQREVDGIHVVLEIEDAGEAGAGEGLLDPGAVVLLGSDQELDAGANLRTVGRAGRDQAEERPGGLRGGRRSLSG